MRPMAMAPEDTTRTSAPRGMEIGDVLGQRRKPGMVQAPAGAVDEERGADLQDDAAELADLRAHGCHSSWAIDGLDLGLGLIDHGKQRLQHLLHALSGGGGHNIGLPLRRPASASSSCSFSVSSSRASAFDRATISGFSASPWP